jgi:hypothetical protein
VARQWLQDRKLGDYRSYLLRLWRAAPGQPWRASLQSTATSEIRAFGTVGALVAFIVASLTEGDDDSPGPPDARPGTTTEEVQ